MGVAVVAVTMVIAVVRVTVMVGMAVPLAKARLAKEGHDHHARHIDGSDQRRQGGDHPEELAPAVGQRRSRPGLPEDLILAEETGEKREATDRQPPGHHRGKGDRHILLQSAHPADVLFFVHSVNDGTRAEKEERLEEGVSDDVKDTGSDRPDSAGEEHITELGDGRVGQHLLDVILGKSDRRREDGRRRPNNGHDRHCRW